MPINHDDEKRWLELDLVVPGSPDQVWQAIATAAGNQAWFTWALLAGSAGTWLKGNVHFLRRQRFVTGAIYLGLGVTTAFAGHGKSK